MATLHLVWDTEGFNCLQGEITMQVKELVGVFQDTEKLVMVLVGVLVVVVVAALTDPVLAVAITRIAVITDLHSEV